MSKKQQYFDILFVLIPLFLVYFNLKLNHKKTSSYTVDPLKPFNDLSLLPPKVLLETPRVLKKAIAANRELAELKGAGLLIPNQSVLIQTLGLQEAKLSSEIENIVTTNDELYRAFADITMKIDHCTKEVLRYEDAFWYGYEAISQKNRLFSAALFEEISGIIIEKKPGIRKLPGTKLKNPNGDVIYTPPDGEEIIRKKIDNLVHFLYEEKELDPLVKLALMHYQFEAIHPFYDGNGRTGRILNILYLVHEKLLDLPILYLSKYIIENKNDYYVNLRNVTFSGDWESWILYMLDCIETMSRVTREKVFAIDSLFSETAAVLKKNLPKVYSKDLVEVLFRYPYCKIKFLEEIGVHRETASKYLQQITNIGLLEYIQKGREKYFINKAFLELLTK